MVKMINERVFITGATGFIGQYVCRALDQQGIEYLGLTQKILSSSSRFVSGSILDVERLNQIIDDFKPTAVLHLAAVASPAHKDIAKIYEINVAGSENLLEAIRTKCNDRVRLVMVSSAGVYGNQNKKLLDEETPLSPVNHYSYSKMVMEMLARQYEQYVDLTIVRPFNIIGKGQQENFLIPKLVRAFVLKQKSLSLGNIDTARDYMDVECAADAFIRLIFQREGIYKIINFCTGKAATCHNILEYLSKLTGHTPTIQISDSLVRRNEIYRLIGDPTKFEVFMGKRQPSMPLEEILKEMIEYYKERGSTLNV